MHRLVWVLMVGLVLVGCGGRMEPGAELTLDVQPSDLPTIPEVGTDTTLDIGTWNLEWFGDRSNGPSPEGVQLDNVWTVLDAVGVDIWAVQEVGRAYQFQDLLEQLAGYDGLLATDPEVTDGEAYYSDFAGGELKVGLIYRTGAVTVDSARVILPGHDDDFAGRPPVQVHLTVGDGETQARLVMIVLHAKAGADAADRERRARGSAALLAYLDSALATAPVLVVGDFNDDVDSSITAGQPSPYRNFVDAAGYAFPTAALSEAGESSTVFYDDMIDHHLATDELMADYVAGTARVVPAGTYLPGYGDSTTDHYPVVARYSPGGGAVALPAPRQHVTLTWTGTESETVDVYRDDTLLVTTANDGTYIDTVGLSIGLAYSYRVCEAGTTICTDDVRVEP